MQWMKVLRVHKADYCPVHDAFSYTVGTQRNVYNKRQYNEVVTFLSETDFLQRLLFYFV